MSLRVTIIDMDSERVAGLFDAAAKRATDFRPVLNDIGLDMMRVERALFASQGRRGGGSWGTLKPDTVRKKGTVQILRTEGARAGYSKPGNDALYRSVTNPGATGQLFRVTKNRLTFGTSVKGAEAQQFGTRKMRARPFIRFTAADTSRWMRMLMEYALTPFAKKS